MGQRLAQLTQWVCDNWVATESLDPPPEQLETVSGDASFRRYFRARTATSQFIAVDAPPDKEDSAPFVNIGKRWRESGVRVPQILIVDLEQGFMLLEDFGDEMLLPNLNTHSDAPYATALEALLQLQVRDTYLSPYDEPVLLREMHLFDEWFLGRALGLDSKDWLPLLEPIYTKLVERAQVQLQVPVHRDYHSRNLMLLTDGSLGVIDYQDALLGPITYDLVSLLRDSYIEWPQAQVEEWVESYRQQLASAGFEVPSTVEFLKDFYLMGMQRQLKVVGIFCRLWLRDGKSGYLKDIPRTFNYLHSAAARYPEFAQLDLALSAMRPLLETHPLLAPHFGAAK
jgi:aminoglycoside/choline kinase family phosphotransferase